MATDYNEKQAAVQERIARLETDQQTFTDAAKLERAKVKLAQAKELLERVKAKQAALVNGQPPKAEKAAKAPKAAKRAKRAKR